ncbi:MAG: glycosyl transferase [Isosphaeraceae bacterium]|jgi:glycosyltransferase involved in cell wall biosynthesis|nr:MAG: glycosyl transferase [Isosphaeraceae bacterium]
MEPPLRIAYVISYFHPLESGAERQALVQGAELARRGHQVWVLTRHVGHLPEHEVVQGVRVERCLRVHDQSRLFVPSFIGQVASRLRKLRREIDLVQTHQALWEAAGTGLARPFLGRIPSIVQPASSGRFGEAEELSRQKGRIFLRRLILANTHFVAISADIEAQWRRLGVPASRMTRIASGVDTSRFRPGPVDPEIEAALPPRPRFIFTGRFHPQKNLAMLIEAWSQLVRVVPAYLVLLGWGPDRPALEVLIEERGLSHWVRILDVVPDPAPYLRAADGFVLPSIAEGMSNSLLEAMASGLPCLVSAIGGNEDLVVEGRTGRLLPPHEPAAWARAVQEIVKNPAEARAAGEAARTRVCEEFAVERVMDRYEALFRRLIAQAGRTA